MANEIQFSAKFKRDYVAALAVVIFFAIVLAEIVLAVSIPAYLQREDAMALQARRLHLLESFDAARNLGNSLKPNGETAELEARLVMWNLNLLATYLRENSADLTGEEIASLQKDVRAFTGILARIQSGETLCRERKLDTSFYVNSLITPVEKR